MDFHSTNIQKRGLMPPHIMVYSQGYYAKELMRTCNPDLRLDALFL
jgi:hypothetical protein